MKVLLLLLAIFSQASTIVFNCTFAVISYNQLPASYTCDPILSNIEDSQELTAVFGVHLSGKNNDDVQLFDLANECRNANLQFIPLGMEKFFPNLSAIRTSYCNISELSGNELNFYENLEWFGQEFTPLERVPGNFFSTIQK